MTMNLRLQGEFTLLSPLSHIGETLSTTAYLVQDPILQEDGRVEEVFCYSGNAWRGQIRDLAATYMLERLGSPTVPLDTFHLLFSGGRIGGDQQVDIAQARRMRAAVPMLSLLGGGVGNQIIAGKTRVANCYPICAEAAMALPRALRERARKLSYRGLTYEKSFSRRDDERIEDARRFIASPPAALIEGDGKGKRKKADDDAATQMRMTVELVAAGVKLWSEIDLLGVSDVELGALVSALHLFSRSPHIGGQANKGHGRVELNYEIVDLDTGETAPFIAIERRCLLAPPAAAAKEAYDQHLRTLYDQMLANNKGEIVGLLSGAA